MAENIANSLRMLLISRELSVVNAVRASAQRNAWEFDTAAGGIEALERAQSDLPIRLVLLDLVQGDSESLHTLRWLHRVRPDLPVILLSTPDNTPQVLEAIRLGADDYLLKPWKDGEFEKVINRQLSGSEAGPEDQHNDQIESIGDDLFFVTASPSMQKVRARAELLGQVNGPVLILGEPGTGKEVTARLIHKLSVRSGFRFVKVNCSALSGDFIESELFGYTATTSTPAKPGKLELAHRGTIFLDEIAEMPLPLQSKLLRVLQDRQFFRVSDESQADVDVRVIATSSAGIEQSLAAKKLREDLYYRLSAFTIPVPPLRQRKEEIPILIGHLMNRMARHYGLPSRSITPNVLDKCLRHAWPGNLVELENFVKRYLVTGEDAVVLQDSQLNLDPGDYSAAHPSDPENRSPDSLKWLVRNAKGDTERNAIANALEKTQWNRKAASRLLRISYRALLYKIQEYHITPQGAYLAAASASHGVKGPHGE
jgi:DNA-binding NtrC family response regulator